MDTSAKNIKMCQMAKEIRKYWLENQHAGDWVYDPGTLPYEITVYGGWYVLREDGWKERVGEIDNETWLGDEVWLPTQDQLQEMVKKWHETKTQLLQRFASYVDYSNGKITVEMDDWSLERLWLAFVMHEKYGKIWDNEKEEWVKS